MADEAVLALSESVDKDVYTSSELLQVIDNLKDDDAKSYLKKFCKNEKSLKYFLKDYEDYIFIENDRYTSYSEDLEEARNEAAKYFQEKLLNYSDIVSIIDVKFHLHSAPEEVKMFFKKFYADNDFKSFLKSRPDIFILYNDNNVHLISKHCAIFFEEFLREFGDGISFTRVKGHIGQADEAIQSFINKKYPETNFRYFLEENNDIFRVDGKGNVYLVNPVRGKFA